MQVEKITPIVGQFFKAFGANRDPMFWVSMIEEETKELLDAMRDEPRENVLKEYCDLLYVAGGLAITLPEWDHYRLSITEDEANRMQEAVRDGLELASRMENTFDLKTVEAAFNRVHASNMSKLGDDGKPLRRADGKVLKGPNYAPPVLTDLV